MIDPAHIIKQQIFDVSYPEEEGAEMLQSRFSRLQSKSIASIIADVLNEYIPQNRVIKIDKLEVDLGTVDVKNMDHEIPILLREKLAEQLRRMVFHQKEFDHQNAHPDNISITSRKLQIFQTYLRTGTVDWRWYDPGFKSFDSLFLELLEEEPRRFTELIRNEGKKDRVFKRLLWSFSFDNILQLIKVFEPAHAIELESFILKSRANIRSDQKTISKLRFMLLKASLHFFIHRQSRYYLKSTFIKSVSRVINAELGRKIVLLPDNETERNFEKMSSVQRLVAYLEYGFLPTNTNVSQAMTPDEMMIQALAEEPKLLIRKLLKLTKSGLVYSRIRMQMTLETKRLLLEKVYPKNRHDITVILQALLKFFQREGVIIKSAENAEGLLIDLALSQFINDRIRKLDLPLLFGEMPQAGEIHPSMHLQFFIALKEELKGEKLSNKRKVLKRMEELISNRKVEDHAKPALRADNEQDKIIAHDSIDLVMHYLRYGYLPAHIADHQPVSGFGQVQDIFSRWMKDEPIRLLQLFEVRLPHKVVRERLIGQFDDVIVDQFFKLLAQHKAAVGFTYMWYRQAMGLWKVAFRKTRIYEDLEYMTKIFFLESVIRDWDIQSQQKFFFKLLDFLQIEISFPDSGQQQFIRQLSIPVSNEFYEPLLWMQRRSISKIEKQKEKKEDAGSIDLNESPAIVQVLKHYLQFGFVPEAYREVVAKGTDDLLLTALSVSPEQTLHAIASIADRRSVYSALNEYFTLKSMDVFLEFVYFEHQEFLQELKNLVIRSLKRKKEFRISKGDLSDVFTKLLLQYSIAQPEGQLDRGRFIRSLALELSRSAGQSKEDFLSSIKDTVARSQKEKQKEFFQEIEKRLLEATELTVDEDDLFKDASPIEIEAADATDASLTQDELITDDPVEDDGSDQDLIGDEMELVKSDDETELFRETKELEDRAEFEIKEDIYISNSGLIIIAPYLPAYFQKLDLLKDGQFISEEAAVKGIHLLQHLATGKEGFREPELVLNKILCGVPVIQPIESDIEITEKDRDESLDLLNAVIKNWAALKGIPVDQFQHNFLLRDGSLDIKLDRINLKVDKKAYDVLMNSLPWNISIIKNTWMDRILYVEWN